MANTEAVAVRQAGINFNWPHDEDGNPMALITMQASELYGLPNYSNITIGPASITKFVKATDEDEVQGLKDIQAKVEEVVATERGLAQKARERG